MNLFNIKNEIINLNKIVEDLKKENTFLKEEISNLNDEVTNIKVNKTSEIQVINFIDEIKEDIIVLDEKIDFINKKRFFKEIIDIENKNEAHRFLESLEIDNKTINLLLFLNYNKISDLCQINLEDLLIYDVNKEVIEFIIQKSCEKMSLII